MGLVERQQVGEDRSCGSQDELQGAGADLRGQRRCLGVGVLRLSAHTGARHGELFNLRRRDVGRNAREVRITDSAAIVGGEQVKGTTRGPVPRG